MNDRKQHVIKMAHQLFTEKGFHSTSIQDILEYSGISKGTFYNYFSSKNELLIALFRDIFKSLEQDRNELLLGQDPSNIEIFIKQIEIQMKVNQKNKLLPLFEEVILSNDKELKQFMIQGKMKLFHWLYNRFIDLFGENKKPYLLDISIMFFGILQQNIKFFALVNNENTSIHQVITYSVDRIVKMVDEVAESGSQLMQPEALESLLPDCKKTDHNFQQNLCQVINALKKVINTENERTKYLELLDFVLDELLHTKEPRKFLIESTMVSLKAHQSSSWQKEFKKLEQLLQTSL